MAALPSPGPRRDAVAAAGILAFGAAVVTGMHLVWPAPETTMAPSTADVHEVQVHLRGLEPFRIEDVSGAAIELTPGSEGTRTVRLTNPNSIAITVTHLRAVPGRARDGAHHQVVDCPSDIVKVVPMDTPVTIRAESSVQVTMTVLIAHDIPTACTDVTFRPAYSGRTDRMTISATLRPPPA